MIEKYIRVKSTKHSSDFGRVARIIPETKHCWFNAGLVFVRMADTDARRILDLPDTEYISEREYFKGCLGG
ncbi:MAG: hypothetical protein ACTSPB_12170 [Candidatus Thorarchaeota archaeon]